MNDERAARLLSILDKLRAKYPDSGISGLFEFSGAMSQALAERDHANHGVQKLREAAGRGLIDIGYTGEEEPSYLYRPHADLLLTHTPEERWAAEVEAAERFLTDFKDPVTGRPVPGLTGGLKRMQEVFGEAAFIRGLTDTVGGDSAITHALRKLNTNGMLMGIPPTDPRRGIESYGASSNAFSLGVSPDPNTSPEVFWEDGSLRLSDFSMTDNRPHSTDDLLDTLKKAFAGLDRTKARVITLEFGGYRRYLAKRPDGSILYDPMEWMYFHPDHPDFPLTMKAYVTDPVLEKGYQNEEAVLSWLLDEYLPANPGSRFVSISDLRKMAGPELPPQVDWSQIKAMAADFDAQFQKHPNRTSDFIRAGNRFFSNAEAFELMVQALAEVDKSGAPPQSLKPIPMSGPIVVPNDMGPIKGSVTVRDVLHAATVLAPLLRNTEWKVIPDNAVPAYIQTGAVKVNSAQFLRPQPSAIVHLSPDKHLPLTANEAHSDLTYRYPKNTPIPDQGLGWTLKPAPLQAAVTGASAAGR